MRNTSTAPRPPRLWTRNHAPRGMTKLLVAAAAGLAITVPAACSTTTGGASDPAAANGKPAQEMVASGMYPVEDLDPDSAKSGSAGKEMVDTQIFSRLLRLDEHGKLVGDLATHWKPNPTATQWTFTLRPNAKFTDGTALDSEDVVASFKRLIALDSPNAANFPDVTAKATDPATVEFSSKQPDAALPSKLTTLYMLPAETKAAEGALPKIPIGSGPFKVQSFQSGQNVVLVPNKDYYDGAPTLTKLTFRTIPDISTRLTALKTGEVNVIWGVPDDQLTGLKSVGNIKTEAVDSNGNFLVWYNSSRPAFKDAKVRRALWQAIDFNTIIKELYPVTGEPADSMIAPTVFGYAPQQPVKYDPQAAKQALIAAGFDFNKTYELQYQSQFKPFVSAMVSDLAKIGVKIDAREKEQALFIEDLLALRWDINFQQVGTAGLDASTNLGRLYTCAGKRNGYCNPKLDRILKEAGETPDQEKRKDLYAQAQKIIWDDAVGMFPMFVKVSYAWTSNVSGFTLDPQGLPYFKNAKVG